MERDEYNQTPALDVAIVGAGLAGLVAAIGLAECGHNVEVRLIEPRLSVADCRPQVYERSQFANEVGAAITTCPNASRVLQYYGLDTDRAQGMSLDDVRHNVGASSSEDRKLTAAYRSSTSLMVKAARPCEHTNLPTSKNYTVRVGCCITGWICTNP